MLPFLERWFNDLLMGKNPINKTYPEKPGMFLYGTQNPVTMSGRQRPSNAFKRRVITYNLPQYPHEEMVSILVHEGLDLISAIKMVDIFTSLVDHAHKNYLTPVPTFRNLLRLARISKNSKQAEALELFFNAVKVPSLQHSVLKAEAHFNNNTLNALSKHLTDESMKFFDLNIGLFDSLITKYIPEAKIQLLLKFINAVEVPSLRHSVLKAKAHLNNDTLKALTKHLTDESMKFFDLNIGLFDSLITKYIPEDKIQLLLKFINAVEVPSLRHSALKAEAYLNNGTLKALTKHLTDKSMKFFDLNIGLFESLITKYIPEDRIQLLLKFISILKSNGGAFDTNQMGYFTFLSSLPIEKIEDFQSLYNFFKKQGNLLSDFLKEIQFYAAKHTDANDDCLIKVIELRKFLCENASEDKDIWTPILAKATPVKIDLLYKWLNSYQEDDKALFINLLFTNAHDFILKNPSAANEKFIINSTKRLLNNSMMELFDFNHRYKFNERIKLMHHLEMQTFVTPTNHIHSLWTKIKNSDLLKQIYEAYTTLFAHILEKPNTSDLLMAAKELEGVPSPSKLCVSKKLTHDLNTTLTDYLGCFWIRKQRSESAKALRTFISKENIDYPSVLKAISNARDQVFINDTQKERNMHRFGHSRYYETLNKLEDMLVNSWIKDKEAISSFKIYLPHYEKTLEHSKKCLDDAIHYENTHNNKHFDHNTKFKNYPGYIRALYEQVNMREEVLETYKSSLVETEIDSEGIPQI